MAKVPAAAVLDALPLAAAAIRARQRQAGAGAPRPTRPDVVPWARENVMIVTPWAGRVPFEPYPYQARFLEDAAPRRLILKARQVGMSNVVGIEAIYKATTQPARMILMVSRTGQLAQHLITYCRHALVGLRDPPVLVRENLSELEFANGSRIVSLAASPSAGRGFPATDVYLDEFAFAEYADLIYQAIVPTLPAGGQLTVLSTANGRSNLFFRLWSGLEGGLWSRHTIHWSDCPRYRDDPAWEPATRAAMTRQAFAQEYDLDFVTSGAAVFDPGDLEAALAGWNPDPRGCEALITAWDIGRRQDHTVGLTIGRRGEVWHEVAYERMLAPYPVVQAAIEARARAFRGRTYVESNGVGDPVIENLRVRVEPFTTTARTKVQAIQALQLLLQQQRFKFGSEQLGRELGLYEWEDQHLVQDSVMAAAMAAFAAAVDQPAGVWVV